jgi:very-short-patch-repair endonuclease
MDRTRIARGLRREQTPAERLLWAQLRGRRLAGLKFRRQYAIEGAIVDFACFRNRLVVELDGAPHDHEAAQQEDATRDGRLLAAGWRVVRFENRDVVCNLEGVLHEIG